LQDYADDIIAFLKVRLTEPAPLFGHSLGGMVALLVAAQYPQGVRAVAVGDAPLSSKTWRTVLQQGRERLAAWRDLAGGQKPMAELIEILKETPVEVPGQSQPVLLREVMGEDSPVFAWLATNLYQNDPDMLTALLDRFEATAAGYELSTVLPAITCPVLLLQADPTRGGVMTDLEVAQALPLLAQPSHVRLEGLSHVFHNERKEPVVRALQAFFQG
jgi:pimeloyl-ACP methyl ester carboxylesterase